MLKHDPTLKKSWNAPLCSQTHHLKTWTEYFWAVVRGDKKFEIRVNDRDYKVGDILVLEEYDPTRERYTGNRLHRHVTYMLDDPHFVKSGMVCMSISRPK